MQISNSKIIALAVILLITVLVILYLVLGSSSIFLSDDDPVATVNGEEILRSDFNDYRSQIEAQNASGQEVDDELVLDDMINEKLLLQEAERLEISATEEEMNEQINLVTSQIGGEEELANLLDEEGMTQEDLKNILRRQIIVEKYVDLITEEQNIEVTGEEVASFYNEALELDQEIPPLEEVEEYITQQLLNDKVGQAMESVIAGLRSEAEIEILI